LNWQATLKSYCNLLMSPNRVYTTHAVVLKRSNLGEADRIVTIFSKEYGKMKVIAKGVRRVHSRRAPYLEVFSHVTLILHRGKTWDVLSEATPMNTFSFLRGSLALISEGYYVCELVDVLTPEHQEHRDIYTLLLEALMNLNEAIQDNPVELSRQFALELLRSLGYLAHDRSLPMGRIDPYIERIIEKRLHTPKILSRLSGTISL